MTVRRFSSSSDSNNSGGEEPMAVIEFDDSSTQPSVPYSVPLNFPVLPVIAVNNVPLFPKIVKILEVTDERLMDIIRRKVKLGYPYCGVFMKHEDKSVC